MQPLNFSVLGPFFSSQGKIKIPASNGRKSPVPLTVVTEYQKFSLPLTADGIFSVLDLRICGFFILVKRRFLYSSSLLFSRSPVQKTTNKSVKVTTCILFLSSLWRPPLHGRKSVPADGGPVCVPP